MAVALVVAACGGEDEPELTIEERLEAAKGRALTTAEVTELLDTGAALCAMDDRILDALWFRLDEEQLDYQDVVFGQLCPERSVLYAGHTGRFVSDEARESGVSTSTTRPSTTAPSTTAGLTSGQATTRPSTTAGLNPGQSTASTDPTTGQTRATIAAVPGPSSTVEVLPSSTATTAASTTPSTGDGEGG